CVVVVLELPELDYAVTVCNPSQPRSVVGVIGVVTAIRVSYRPSTLLEAQQHGQLLAAGSIPQVGRCVPAPGEHKLAIRGEGHGGDFIFVPFEGANLLPGGRIPQTRRLVLASGEHVAAIRGEGHGQDLTCMPFEGAYLLTGGGIPQPRCLILATGEN